jgi:hypothetical protein
MAHRISAPRHGKLRFPRLLTLCISLCAAAAYAQKSPTNVLGEWEGESKCTVPGSPCHDEHVIYEITPAKNSKDAYSLAGFKVVNGERQFMGTLLCHLDAVQPTLTCTANTPKHDEWTFHITGSSMTGTLTLDPGKLLYRRINVSRKGQS